MVKLNSAGRAKTHVLFNFPLQNKQMTQCMCKIASGPNKGKRCPNKASKGVFCARHGACKQRASGSPARRGNSPKGAGSPKKRAPSPPKRKARALSPIKVYPRVAPRQVVAPGAGSGRCKCVYASGAKKGTRCTAASKGVNFCGRHADCKNQVQGSPRRALTRSLSPKRAPSPKKAASPMQCKCAYTSGGFVGFRCIAKAVPGKDYCKRHINCKKQASPPRASASPQSLRTPPRALKASPIRGAGSPKRKARAVSPSKRCKCTYASGAKKGQRCTSKATRGAFCVRHSACKTQARGTGSPSRRVSSPRRAPSPVSPVRAASKSSAHIFNDLSEAVIKFTDMEQPFRAENFLPDLVRKHPDLDIPSAVDALKKLYKEKLSIMKGADCRRCEEILAN